MLRESLYPVFQKPQPINHRCDTRFHASLLGGNLPLVHLDLLLVLDIYRWHPWFGRLIHVHQTIDKPGDAVVRCSRTGRQSERLLEVSAWIFDRASCVACRRADMAHVGLDTLMSLAELTGDAGFTSLDKSDSSLSAGATLDSEATIRRSANAAQNDEEATRAVSGDPIHSCDTNPALAEPARRHAASADTLMARLMTEHADAVGGESDHEA